jgi:hypothetical protein
MLKLRTIGTPPNRLRSEPLYGIVTRNTLFGIHKSIHSGVDKQCTKSTLWFSSQKDIADFMLEQLNKDMRNGTQFHHLNTENILCRERTGSLMPLRIEPFMLDDLEKICILHHFDMYIATSMHKMGDIGFSMDCYEYVTHDWPHRNIVERYMRDMLHKKD